MVHKRKVWNSSWLEVILALLVSMLPVITSFFCGSEDVSGKVYYFLAYIKFIDSYRFFCAPVLKFSSVSQEKLKTLELKSSHFLFEKVTSLVDKSINS